jgi:hypothetical protein
MSSKGSKSKNVSETGQIPRHILDGFKDLADQARESMEDSDSGSITGIFRMKKRAEGVEDVKDDDAPTAGSAAAPASQ